VTKNRVKSSKNDPETIVIVYHNLLLRCRARTLYYTLMTIPEISTEVILLRLQYCQEVLVVHFTPNRISFIHLICIHLWCVNLEPAKLQFFSIIFTIVNFGFTSF